MSAPISLKERIKQMAGDNEQDIVPDEVSWQHIMITNSYSSPTWS